MNPTDRTPHPDHIPPYEVLTSPEYRAAARQLREGFAALMARVNARLAREQAEAEGRASDEQRTA